MRVYYAKFPNEALINSEVFISGPLPDPESPYEFVNWEKFVVDYNGIGGRLYFDFEWMIIGDSLHTGYSHFFIAEEDEH